MGVNGEISPSEKLSVVQYWMGTVEKKVPCTALSCHMHNTLLMFSEHLEDDHVHDGGGCNI
jgi:hypothetical protein